MRRKLRGDSGECIQGMCVQIKDEPRQKPKVCRLVNHKTFFFPLPGLTISLSGQPLSKRIMAELLPGLIPSMYHCYPVSWGLLNRNWGRV